MKFLSPFKHVLRTTAALFHGRFSPATVLAWSICVIIILLILILAWDAYLFTQSISPPQANNMTESKTTLTSQHIDNAIRILDQRQIQFDTILHQITGTTTTSF